MNVVFLGLGSIGQRHARLLRAGFPGFRLHALRSGSGTASATALGIAEIGREDLARLAGGVAFIANPTALHVRTALECARLGLHLFVEKPVGNSREGLADLADTLAERGLTSYVAYNLRFHPVIEWLKARVDRWAVASAEVECLSWLPDWRPGTDHLKSYSASAAAGGGALLDLSHELDYVGWLFGGVEEIAGTSGRRSGVTVDAEDFADLRVATGRGLKVRVRLDMGSREVQRGLRLVLADGSRIHADLIASTISGTGQPEPLRFAYGRDTTYGLQLAYFFDHLGKQPMNSVPEAIPLLEKILAFKEAA